MVSPRPEKVATEASARRGCNYDSHVGTMSRVLSMKKYLT
jgi:hypothetical protein